MKLQSDETTGSMLRLCYLPDVVWQNWIEQEIEIGDVEIWNLFHQFHERKK